MADATRVGKMMASSAEYQPTEEDLAYKGWKHLIPFRPSSKNPKTLPLIAAGPLNFATGHWLNSVIFKSRKVGLTEDDIYDTPWRDSAGLNAKRFGKFWNEELAKHGKEKASVARAIMRMIRTRLIFAVLFILSFGAFGVLSPMFFLNEFLEVRESEESVALPTMYALLLLFCMSMHSLCFSCAWGIGYTSAIRVRGGVLSFVFNKILTEQMQNKSVGELVNLCANDGMRLFSACLVGVFAMGSVTSLVGAAYSIYLVGLWGLLGFATFFCLIPFQVILSKAIFKLRKKVIPVTDERIKLMSEIVTAIKLVKMYAWEKSFAKKINDIRIKEKKILSKSLIVQSLSLIFPQSVAIFASAFTFLAMTCTGANLSVTQAFVFLALLNSLKFSLGILPFAVKSIAEGKQACDRMKALLVTEGHRLELSAIEDGDHLVEMKGASFGWPAQRDNSKGKRDNEKKPLANGQAKAAKNGGPKHKKSDDIIDTELQALDSEKEDIVVTLKDITMSLKQGTLLGVCGAVGSGKTSLMQAILGMMKKTDGTIAINDKKKIAYVSQQAWIMNATVRENIIFGHDFDQERYDEVVEACALTSDFSQLPAGDKTEIGERGINLSGGQKQRVSIARAVYSDSDLILLDDPLSAVDAHVGQHIFQNCLKGFLKDKTILFVSHQLQFMTGCDYVLVMKDGHIYEEGTHDLLMSQENGEYSNLIKSFHDSKEKEQKPDSTAFVDTVLARQQSKISSRSRHSSVHSDNDATQQQQKLNGSTEQLTGGTSKPENGRSGNLSNSVQLAESEEMRKRALSVASMKSARSIASKNLARSRKMLNATSDVEGVTAGSVMDLANIADVDAVEFNENNNDSDNHAAEGALTANEDMESGAVKMATYGSYIKAAGGGFIAAGVFGVVLLAVSANSFTNYFLSYWLNEGSGGAVTNQTIDGNYTEVFSMSLLDNERLSTYQTVYGCSLILVMAFALLKSVVYMKTALKASSKLHDKVFRKLVASPMSFFDVTPSGRILNRFSKDMDEIDVNLPFVSEQFLTNTFIIFITVCIIASVFYYFLLAMLPILLLFVVVYRICAKGIRGLKRIENVTRSPLFSHVATTIQGLSTIRAYKKEDQFHREFNRLQDRNNMAMYLFHTAMRWAAVRLDTLSLLSVLATALFVTFMPSGVIEPAYAALALSYAMNMTGLFQFTMRLCIETESRFTSVERVTSYVENLESEAPAIVESCRPESSWPVEGAIEFNNVEMRYRDGLPLVLKGISLDINAQEKIGIVGRTGSGKSSIGMALFRMMELASGNITIDGVDISTIGLEDLRSKLSIIPQDPVLFVGTVRYNLDPFNAYTDDELWSALDQCHVKHTIKSLDGQLDATIVENGENFSVGERQLLCMARALLRHSKILLLDEATAAIDTETDTLIQETIKDAFADCTMLTIAHRLNTVASSDRILVLDDGKVIEFDTPDKLLSDPESVFAQMMSVQESQKQQAMDGGHNSS